MTSPTDPASVGTITLVDADVLRDITDALDGRWRPADETDPILNARYLAAARLRLYGEPDRSGWRLVAPAETRDRAAERGDTDWSLATVTEIEAFPDAPAERDVEGLVRLYRSEDIGPEAATALATAVLWEPVRYLVSVDRRAYRHSRAEDLRNGLEVITVGDAVDLLEIAPGEEPLHDFPPESPLADTTDHWWVP
jgi:hypothetical protein